MKLALVSTAHKRLRLVHLSLERNDAVAPGGIIVDLQQAAHVAPQAAPVHALVPQLPGSFQPELAPDHVVKVVVRHLGDVGEEAATARDARAPSSARATERYVREFADAARGVAVEQEAALVHDFLEPLVGHLAAVLFVGGFGTEVKRLVAAGFVGIEEIFARGVVLTVVAVAAEATPVGGAGVALLAVDVALVAGVRARVHWGVTDRLIFDFL